MTIDNILAQLVQSDEEIAIEAQRVPTLRLTAVFSLARLCGNVWRIIIGIPLGSSLQKSNRLYGCLFVEFPEGCFLRILALVDPALWHLPRILVGRFSTSIVTFADPDQTVPVYKKHTDTRAVRPFSDAFWKVRSEPICTHVKTTCRLLR